MSLASYLLAIVWYDTKTRSFAGKVRGGKMFATWEEG